MVDGQPGISDIEDAISKNFLFTILDQHKTPLMERFLGWWLKEIVTLLKDTTKSINNKFVTQKLQDLAYQFHNESLPIDFISEEPDWKNNWESKVFVKQVRLITERDGRIKNAIRDYYRAFEQRSRWAREELLVDDELEKYEQKLVEEWHRFKERTLDEMNPKSDDDERVVGNKIFNWVEGTANFPIRKKVTEEYITRGSYHILADNLKVGWHPKFVERLKELLENE